jgi:cystathionine beta-synthase
VAGALKWARDNDAEGLKVLVILPDSGSRYLSKIFSESWMEEGGYLEPEATMGYVRDLVRLRGGQRELISVPSEARVHEVVGLLKLHGVSQVPVVDSKNSVLGILTENVLLERALRGQSRTESVANLIQPNFCTVSKNTEISVVTSLFSKSKVAIILDEDDKAIDIITRIDLIDYISHVATGGNK